MINRGNANNIYGTAGDDHLKGAAGKDHFHVEQNTAGDGGDDLLRGGGGNDKFYFGMTYTDADIVDGGSGDDRMILKTTVDDNLVLGPDNLTSVEHITLIGGAYRITLLDGIGDISIRGYQASDHVRIDASDVHSSGVKLIGGGRGDALIGGAGDDFLVGAFSGGEQDRLTGGPGNDTFKYSSPGESSRLINSQPDLITDFSAGDRIVLPTERAGVESYHIGETPGRVGDVIASYAPGSGITTVDIFTNSDDVADMTILFVGDVSALSVHGDAVLVL